MSEEISLPQGFQATGLHCGVKSDSSLNDLAVFASERPCASAGVFTQNRVVGAPVTISRERTPSASARAVVINSGNANACTGQRGLDDARTMTQQVAERLNCPADDVLVCSTGIIGHFLPMDKLSDGIPQAMNNLAADTSHFEAAARGMMTTDTFPKIGSRTVNIGGKPVTLFGAAKGAAMIAPNMATMLCVVLTDAALTVADAERMLKHSVDRSFNSISVDGHTSTSDTVLLLANGAAEVGPTNADESQALLEALDDLTAELAQMIIRDAEGADHFITLDVTGLATREDAYQVAKTIAESALVKTAIAGADPNWGRIISAAGYSGIPVDPEKMTLHINGTRIFQNGSPTDYDDATVSQTLRDNREVHIELECGLGDANVRFWTSDLTQEYVRLNSEYTT
ncbi:bifunctional glutamate N-acetyltransferase/amino-acid acetyltransferase ArgJ [Thalassoroseus pseudoceratinae]|uniref:bifunctional glutamate N-acetyltransferase/amino-acid acetyltransferase ArgJ n=1 Tax=Thalassoroseus pseudoceratinae TaxID=2713176 RepID=UPI00141E90CC|nr:bifunctional glutamate N-acetyltransferase/amino-acid acetyltransferase ArgJ [Thalassoroseus pseudoceratinae]